MTVTRIASLAAFTLFAVSPAVAKIPDGSAAVSYTGHGGANGICAVK